MVDRDPLVPQPDPNKKPSLKGRTGGGMPPVEVAFDLGWFLYSGLPVGVNANIVQTRQICRSTTM